MYKDNNKEYIVYKKDGKFYGCINHDGEFDYDLDSHERDMLDHIFKELCFNSNSERIATIEFESELTDIYYDKEHDLYNFKFQSNKELTTEQFSTLNRLFNNRDNVVYIKLNENDYIKRFIKKGKKTILVLLSSAMLLQTGMTLEVQASNDISSNETEIETFNLDDYTPQSLLETVSFEMSEEEKTEKINNLKDAIKNNPNLTEEEKGQILECFVIIEDNIEYLDYNYLLDLYKNKLKIEYVNDSKGTIQGEFYPDNGRIVLYNATDIHMHESVFTHEFCHTLESNKRNYTFSNFFEALNSIYNSEYFGYKIYDEDYATYDTSYNYAKPYLYVLMEILRPETLRRYHFTQDINSLLEEMMTILPSEEKCRSILYGIATAGPRKNDYLITLLKELYEAEYGMDISSNIEVMAILNNRGLANTVNIEDEYDVIGKKLEVKTQKAYFNNENPYYMVPSTYTLVREVTNYIETMSYDDAIEKGLIEYKSGGIHILKDNVELIDDNTVGYHAPIASVRDDIDINEYYSEQQHTKTR